MGVKWTTRTVLELQQAGVLLVEDGNHGEYRPRSEEFVDSGVAFIRAADMSEGRVLFASASKINAVARQRITKGIGAPGDVLLSHKGTVGKVALVPEDAPEFVCSPQTTFWRSLKADVLDRRYLHALLRSRGFHAQLGTRSGETDMAPYVSLTSQRGLVVSFPPISEQRAIANILGTLDDKIELNRKMHQTLEEMVRALFESWFVDFDPVRAKAAGKKPYGMADATAALFPDSFENSELGEIPNGWRVTTIGDHATLQRGTTYSGKLVGLPGPALLGLGSIVPGGGFRGARYKTYGGECPEKLMLRPGELFAALKGATKDGSMVGSVARVPPSVALGRLTQDTVKLQFADSGGHLSRYLYRTLLTPHYREYCANRATGSAQVGLSRDDFLAYPVLMPAAGLLERFGGAEALLSQRQDLADAESHNLLSLRDSLLPKLLSGKLRVTDAEKLAIEVA